MSNNDKRVSTLRLPKQARRHQSFVVGAGQEAGLLAFLTTTALADKSRTTVKQLLQDRFISVNEEPTTQWDKPLQAGDLVVLHPTPLPAELRHPQVRVLWQDEHLIMIHKAPGIPTVASGQERDRTAMEIVSGHLKKFNPRAKVFLLNRIDKDSAGFVLMAKSEAMQSEMTDHWDRYVERQQFAVAIEGHLSAPEGYLAAPSRSEDKQRKPSSRVRGGITAGEARYRVLMTTELGSLLSIGLQRGRNNRLRKQFAELKTPILGDWRNGSSRRDLGCVALETVAFGFVHPITGRRHDFDQPIPATFRRWLRTEPQPARTSQKKA